MLGALFRTMKPFAPPPPPGAQPPPLWGSEEHLRALFGGRVEFRTLERDVLDITAFEDPHDYARHFKSYYGPTIAVYRAIAEDAEKVEALDRDLVDLAVRFGLTEQSGVTEWQYLLVTARRA